MAAAASGKPLPLSRPPLAPRPRSGRAGRWPALSLALSLAGCVDYGLAKPDEAEVADGGAAGDGGATGDPMPTACGEPRVEAEVAVNEACLRVETGGELDPVEEWSIATFEDYPEYDQVLMAPVVGALFDTNGDGVVDRGDRPSVVVVTDDSRVDNGKHGVLRIVSGLDGRSQGNIVMVEVDGDQVFPYRYANVALGDVDADGAPELVVLVEVVGAPDDPGDGGGSDTAPPDDPGDGGGDTGGGGDNPIFPAPPTPGADIRCTLAAFDPEGALEWLADGASFDCAGHAPALADLDADGHPEVVLGRTILNGEDGTVQATGSYDEGRHYAYAEIGMHSVVADLDMDGVQEVIAGRSVYRPDGTLRCMAEGDADGFTAVADLDLDGQGEFVVVGDGEVALFDTDCAALHAWTLDDGGNGGPPAIGDLDADGQPEIALCSATHYRAFETDGSLLWAQEVSDVSSHATGSLIFDFESDGIPEVVYADETALRIFDGATGRVRYVDDSHTSRTLHDYPTVADVDKDGVTEIIVPNGGGHYDSSRTGIYVLGSATGSWQSGRPVWNQHAYSITNVDDDLGIPASPAPNWPTHNSFRSGDPNPVEGDRWPDAVPVARVCTDECATTGELVLDIALANQGAGALRAGVPLYAWYLADSGLTRDIEVVWSTGVVEEGAMTPAVRLRIPGEDLVGATVYLAADLDPEMVGYAAECDEDNNMTVLVEASCP